jgi:dethiobiotin synthetase
LLSRFYGRELREIFFITGTDTGVGKTVLTTLLVRHLRERGVNAAALKPVCSGGRMDARMFFAATGGSRWQRHLQTSSPHPLTIDEINPWHFRAAIAPLLAARREHRKVQLPQVLSHIRAMRTRFEVLLVEGAGGLLSPLGCSGNLRPSQNSPAPKASRYKQSFDSRDLIVALPAVPIIVAPNRLGAANQILLTLEALPSAVRRRAKLVLMSPRHPDLATGTNVGLLGEFFDSKRIFELPWLGGNFSSAKILDNQRVQQTLRSLL